MVTRSPAIASLDARAEEERAYALAAGREAFICSLSGGVDSATTAAIAARALPQGAVGLLLPCSTAVELQGERGKDIEDAQRVAEQLHMPAVVINLSDLWRQAVALYEGALRELQQKRGLAVDEESLRWAVNNLKPTLRMMTAGFFADALRGLTMGTDNAVENFLGYFSVRGDGIADRQPIRDCTKGEVRVLAEEAGLPPDIVQRTPTAGLWPGQTDEGELGFTYDQVDAFLVWLLQRHLQTPSLDDTLTVRPEAVAPILAAADLPVPREVAERIVAQNQRTRYKRKSDDLITLLRRRGLA